MSLSAFQQRFIKFSEYNRQRLVMDLREKTGASTELRSRWGEAMRSLVDVYRGAKEKWIIAKALTDPYFPLNMMRRLNVEEFGAEPDFTGLSDDRLAGLVADHLLARAKIFLYIRQDLASLNRCGELSSMKLQGSPKERLPDGDWCTYCGRCCEIRGGPPEFTGAFQLPERWPLYFRGDAFRYQRFCPFLFEYFSTEKFFCAIYLVKPKCCWAFGREECEFLQHDLAREQAARAETGGA